MTEQLQEFMTEELGIIDRVGFNPFEGVDLFEDVGGNVWTLEQIIQAYEDR